MIIQSNNLIISPVVSVVIITYNQENTISQTIDSILRQKGDFTLEIVIGDDASSDLTGNICREYQLSHPECIRLLIHDTNQGIVGNFINTLRLCRGKYIGICAGDDYWCDEFKLEKQLHFFARNPDYGVVSTAGYRLLVEKNKLVEGIAPLTPVKDGNVFDLTWKGGVYAMPLSLLIKSELIANIDFDEFVKRKFSVEDVPLQAILAKRTKFGHIPDLCVVYRVYKKSHTFINFNHPKYIEYHAGLVAIRRYLYELFPNEVQFSEEWAENYLAYRSFLKSAYQLDYKSSRSALNCVTLPDAKIKRANILTNNIVTFFLFSLYKRLILWKSERI